MSTNQNHFKIKKTKFYYFQSQPKSLKPSQILNPTHFIPKYNQTHNFKHQIFYSWNHS